MEGGAVSCTILIRVSEEEESQDPWRAEGNGDG